MNTFKMQGWIRLPRLHHRPERRCFTRTPDKKPKLLAANKPDNMLSQEMGGYIFKNNRFR